MEDLFETICITIIAMFALFVVLMVGLPV